MITDRYEIFFSRINAYRALASPSLISLSSKVSSDIPIAPSHTILLSLSSKVSSDIPIVPSHTIYRYYYHYSLYPHTPFQQGPKPPNWPCHLPGPNSHRLWALVGVAPAGIFRVWVQKWISGEASTLYLDIHDDEKFLLPRYWAFYHPRSSFCLYLLNDTSVPNPWSYSRSYSNRLSNWCQPVLWFLTQQTLQGLPNLPG